jgi:hypothetical protein
MTGASGISRQEGCYDNAAGVCRALTCGEAWAQ